MDDFRALFGAPKVLLRKLRAFGAQVGADGIVATLGRARARFNKLEIVQFGIRGRLVPWRVRTLKHWARPPPQRDEVVVLSVVRNGMPWLHTFLLHHRELGARHFVILDNGSTDGTREYLSAQDDVELVASDAPYRHYENTFKRYICNRFARDRWCLFVDVDELLAYPGMRQRSLADLTRFAEACGFTAVATQMLDLFSDVPMADMPDSTGEDLRALCKFYETRDIERVRFPAQGRNVLPEGIAMHFGGVRRRVFGTNNGLTKVSLFFNGEGLVPFARWHFTRHARLADFSLALLHYPFNRQFRDKVLEAAASGRYGWLTTDEYKAYGAIMRDNPGLSMKSEATRCYGGPEQLVVEGFLTASPAFARWVGLASGA